MKILDSLSRLARLIFVHINSIRSTRLFVCLSVRPTRRSPEVRMRGRKERVGGGREFEERAAGRRGNIRAGSDLPEQTRLEHLKHLDTLSLKRLSSTTTLPGMEMLKSGSLLPDNPPHPLPTLP